MRILCLLTRYSLSFWLLACLFFTSFSASAASTAPYLYVSIFEGSSPTAFTSLQSACDAHIPSGYVFASKQPNYNTVGDTVLGPYYVAAGYSTGSYAMCYYSPVGGGSPVSRGFYYGPTCSGSMPTTQGGVKVCSACPSGFVDQGGTCTNAPPPCPASSTKVSTPLITADTDGVLKLATTELCITNPAGGGAPGAVCGVSCASGAVSVDPLTGTSQMFCDSASFTGSACSPSSLAGANPGPGDLEGMGAGPPDESGNCPPGTASGEVNNVHVCLPSGSNLTTNVKTTTQGTKTLTTNKSQTVNSDGSVTTTITNIYNDGTTSTSSTTVSDDRDNNLGKSGSGKSPGEDDGPIPEMDTSVGDFELIPVKTLDNPVFSTTILPSTGTCPPPLTFAVFGVDMSIDFQPICDISPMIRAVILLVSGVVALRAVVSK